ncbi:hypothetical protein R6Q59_035040, partial [Mikania micrantha]
FCSDRRALLLIKAWHLPRRPGVGHALKRHPFSGLVDSAGIVHHLSGPDRHAHTRTLLKRSESVGGAPHKGDPTNQLPYALRVYSPVDSHTCQTPWSVFQDGPNEVPAGRCQEHAGAEARRYSARCQPQSAQRHLHKLINSMGFGRHTNPHRSTPRADRRTDFHRSTSDQDASPAHIRFPPDNFKHSLTLFSKGLGLGPSLRTLLQTTIQTTRPSDFQAGLFPVRSPLLRESLLFCYAGFDNDPSAGSPTETLLRLLLPLNDKVQWNSRDVAGSEPPTSPRS